MKEKENLTIYKIFNKKTSKYQQFGYRNKHSWFREPKEFWNKNTDFDTYELHILHYELDGISKWQSLDRFSITLD
jgi:hypothetical protein